MLNKYLISFLLSLLLLIIVFSISSASTNVYLPDGYEESQLRYPVLYIFPDGGDESKNARFADALINAMGEDTLDMILVCPEFSSETNDIRAVFHDCIQNTDASYRTIASPEYRFLAGTGTGGYLAYALGLAEPELIGGMASIVGDFASDNNPWIEIYGSVYDQLETLHNTSPQVLTSVYTYLDAPADDPATDLSGSTDDIGRRLIAYRLPSSIHEFTVRPGILDKAFLDESASRLLNRLTTLRLTDAIQGKLRLSKGGITVGESVTADIAVQPAESLAGYSDSGVGGSLRLDVLDADGQSVETHTFPFSDGESEARISQILSLEAVPQNSTRVQVRLSAQIFGKTFPLDQKVLVINAADSDNADHLSLEGDWYFNYTGRGQLDISTLTTDILSTWSVVQPGLGTWENGFGNIDETNVSSTYGPDYFDFFIVGNGYYARTFDLPDGFRTDNCVLSIGYVDDRCEVWLNGARIGETGMTDGRPNGATSWADYSAFVLTPELLRHGENTVIVRCFNDLSYGIGGWYAGPVGLYSADAFAALNGSDTDRRFFEITFPSQYAAQAAGKDGSVDVPCIIYLPEGYEDTLRSYPTVYLLHQFNSDYTSYRRDNVKQLLDEGAASGTFDEMIVVIPNSSGDSWWHNAWEKMVTDELVPYIDAHYRTVQDSRWRMTAGFSMGGQGAFGIALRNPDLFSGAVSFSGAFSYGGEANPNIIATRETTDYLTRFALCFISGNQDDYGFGMQAIDLHQCLRRKQVPHRFYIENGGHDSTFYTSYFKDAFAYVRAQMATSHGLREDLLTGSIELTDKPALIIDCPDTAASLYQTIPDSSYTKNPNPDLLCRVYLTHKEADETQVLFETCGICLAAGERISVPFPGDCLPEDLSLGSLTLQVALFDRLLTLYTVSLDGK